MDSEHRALMERVAKSLEALANPPPPVELTDRIADLEKQLANAEENWRGWHKSAVAMTEECTTLRRADGSLRMKLAESERLRKLAESHLRQSNIDLARASRDRNDYRDQCSGLRCDNIRLGGELSECRSARDKMREKIETLSHRARVLQGRLSYWKRKNA